MRLPRPHITRRPRTRLAIVAAALGATVALAASATALVTVYSNDLSSRADFQELTRAGGGNRNCERAYRARGENMRVNVSGQRLCAFAPPVRGDGPRPDHDFSVEARVLKRTPKRVRKATFLSISVRVGGGNSYELQVRPRVKRFRLLRNPNGAAFPVAGESRRDIGGIGELNKLRIRADGATIAAYVNGNRVAKATDPDADDFTGAKLAFGLGSRRDSSKGPVAKFDNIRVRVPSP